MRLVADVWALLLSRRRYWQVPMVVVVLALAVLALFAQGSGVAPFVYTLF